MNSSVFNVELLQTIREAGQKAKHLRQARFEIDEKEPGDYVTSVDRALDKLLTAEFQRLFPHDGIITEENPQSVQVWQQGRSRIWFIDPIDGTSDFVDGSDHYAVMAGLLEDGKPTMGLIYAPESDRLFFGGSAIGDLYVSDGGGEPVPLRSQVPPAHACKVIISNKDERRYGNSVLAAIPAAEFYTLGSFGLKVMDVVLGNACLYIYLNRRVKLWDTVAPFALARMAGIVYCDLQGQPIDFAAQSVDCDTLTHNQVILVGWEEHLDAFRAHLDQALQI